MAKNLMCTYFSEYYDQYRPNGYGGSLEGNVSVFVENP